MTTPAEIYQRGYIAARDVYRTELRIADRRFDRLLRESTERYNETVAAKPWLRAQETERHRKTEELAALMHSQVHERLYEEFRQAVKNAAIVAWGVQGE